MSDDGWGGEAAGEARTDTGGGDTSCRKCGVVSLVISLLG